MTEDPYGWEIAEILTNEACSTLSTEYEEFKGLISNEPLDEVWLILSFLQATKENDLQLHISSQRQMCPLYFKYDHYSYSRSATFYLLSLINVDNTHPGLQDLLRNMVSLFQDLMFLGLAML